MATIVEGNTKVSFSIAITLKCRGGRNSFPWIAPLYPWYGPNNAKCLARWHQVPFFSLWYDSTWNWTMGPLANTLTTRPMSQLGNVFTVQKYLHRNIARNIRPNLVPPSFSYFGLVWIYIFFGGGWFYINLNRLFNAKTVLVEEQYWYYLINILWRGLRTS